MKKLITILIFLSIIIIFYTFNYVADIKSNNSIDSNNVVNNLWARVLYCHDGDTCKIKVLDQLEINVRLAGIDAPEVENYRGNKKLSDGQPFSKEATEYLNSLIQNKKVNIIPIDLDKFNRPIVEMYLNNELVNLKLLEQGYAEVYKNMPKKIDKNKYMQKELEAKKLKRGIWSLEQYLSPKEFRKSKKQNYTH